MAVCWVCLKAEWTVVMWESFSAVQMVAGWEISWVV